ncbi:MAG: hypothetical protein JWL68_2821, partial [Actinomycetia bacterium]|nr:hypothetical protein [Actinomycetes bacterium]
RAKTTGYRGHGGPQDAVLGTLGKIHACSIEVILDSLGH